MRISNNLIQIFNFTIRQEFPKIPRAELHFSLNQNEYA